MGVVLDHTYLVDDWRLSEVERTLRPFYDRRGSARYRQLLAEFGLDLRAKVKDLSRGMAMKLMITVALSHRARLLVFDEPTSGLDPVARDELVGIIGNFLLDERHSVLFSTHITSDLDRIGDYVTLIHGGCIVRTGPKDEILDAYRAVRGAPEDLSGLIGVGLIDVRRTPAGAEALVRTEEADLLGGVPRRGAHPGGDRHPHRISADEAGNKAERPARGDRMSAVARTSVLHLRTVAPYRTQGLLVFGLMGLVLARSPVGLVPALALLLAPLIAVHPFVVADKAGLETLYAVLPLPRRTVLLGHYAWAPAGIIATVTAGTALAILLARAEGVQLGGRTLVTMLPLSWTLFAVNIAIQFPLLIRFGYAASAFWAPPCHWRWSCRPSTGCT
ncbi:AAA family ATPase [Streptomyces beihaiensis]